MNDYQAERHTSNKLVVKIARENQETIKLIPDFEEGINRQDEINIEIEKNSSLQEKDTSGVTENKKFTIENLRNQTLEISGAVFSYAVKKNDKLLQANVDYKAGAVSRMTPVSLINAANVVLEAAKKVPVADLAKAGISVAELTAYEEIATYFKTISESPREAQIDTSLYTNELIKLFKESSKLYKNTLDRLARQFKSKAPEFYYKYRSARKSIHRGPDGSDNTGASK